MYLVKLVPKEISGPWQLLGICDDSGRSVRDFLCTLPPNLKKISFRSIFAVATEKGPFFLSKELCHYINKEEKIYEFIKGRIRIVFFTDGADKIIICTH